MHPHAQAIVSGSKGAKAAKLARLEFIKEEELGAHAMQMQRPIVDCGATD